MLGMLVYVILCINLCKYAALSDFDMSSAVAIVISGDFFLRNQS